jgi:hypothetical protein
MKKADVTDVKRESGKPKECAVLKRALRYGYILICCYIRFEVRSALAKLAQLFAEFL